MKNPYLTTLYIYLSDTCGLSCAHCWLDQKAAVPEQKGVFTDQAVIEKVVEEAMPLGLKAVKLTGGEPLLHKDIIGIIKRIGSKDLNIFIETSGYDLSRDIIEVLQDTNAVLVSVSLHGGTPDVHEALTRVKGSFERTVRNIEELTSAGLRVQLIAAVWGNNIAQIGKIADLAKGLRVSSLKLNPVICAGRGADLHKRGDVPGIRDIIVLRDKIRDLREKIGLDIVLDIPCVFFSPSQIAKTPVFCNIKNILGITPDGSFSICGIGKSFPGMALGKAGKDPLVRIWNDHPLLREIRLKLPGSLKGVCGNCLYKGICLGKCRAEAYFMKQDLYASNSFCQQALEQGLFPSEALIDPSLEY